MKLEIKDIVKVFPDGQKGLDHASRLDHASLCIETPCFMLLSGKNGSGKSLLVRHILGLESPDSGEVLLDGKPANRQLAELRRRIALVFQEPEHQILGLTVMEDAEFGPRAAGEAKESYKEKANKAIKAVGLSGFENRLCASLSGGEKRRLAIASALVSEPELIILDEPFNDLDWDGASELLEILLKLHKDGLGIVVISHDLEKCLAHADRLVVMDAGRVIADAVPKALWDKLPGLGLRRPEGDISQLQKMSWLKAAKSSYEG